MSPDTRANLTPAYWKTRDVLVRAVDSASLVLVLTFTNSYSEPAEPRTNGAEARR